MATNTRPLKDELHNLLFEQKDKNNKHTDIDETYKCNA